MKKSFKKLGFVSLVASSVLLGSMNATDLETYAALQKPSHVFGNYAKKSNKGSELSSDSLTQQQAQNTAQSDTTQATTLENTASSGTPAPSTPPTKKDETSGSGDKHTASSGGTGGDKHTASSGSPTPSTPPTKETPPASGGTSGSSVASQLVKDTTMVNNLKSVSVSAMNTTLSGVTQLSQQTATISNLLSGSPNLGNMITNAQGLSSAFSALESAQNTLKGYLDSSSATIGQLTNGSNAVVGALDKAINQVDMALADLATADTQKTQAVALVAASNSATTTTDAINFLNALKANLTAQKDAFMSVHKNIQTAVAQAQATYTPSVINTNNYGQMYGVDAMAGYKWFFGKKKRFGFRSYGYYSYNHANLSFVGSQLGIMEGASQVNNFTYGVGFDALYNFYESKEGYNTAGLFLGFGLGGDSFIVQGESYLKSQMRICNDTAGCSASMNTSYFQMPVEFGFRSNFSKHSGIEVGLKLPLFTNQFYKERGVDGSVDVFYKRNFSIYFNYMINF
ncbi:outer membrane protein [Helicobacter pylori Hp P-13]|uniref:Outer membrane protein family protein n=1 Tax=Helicobacter pylori Hp P-13b TaxID=992107 RepID=A0ABC9QST0_HELPX|nr:outer membrane beta-barrel protein [Helicobacter pylori]EJC09964.1 outer membrane protein [Helicobacter pylori Hp P-13]EJC33506.1 outer membrane protein family protein [Helicobacter pylori Hp P-13b]